MSSLVNYVAGLSFKKIILFCCLLISIAYVNSLSVDFIWDDRSLIVANPQIRELKLPQINFALYQHVNSDKFVTPVYSRPLQIASYATDYAIWKLNPFGYHLTNLILHILNALLIFVFLKELLKNTHQAFCGALLFGVNPVFTSAVTYISGRADLLLLMFSLAMVIAFIKSIKTGILISSYYIVSLLCGIFVLASKEIGALSFIFLLSVDKLSYKFTTVKKRNLIFLPYFLIFLGWQLLKPVALPGFKLNLGTLKDIFFMLVTIIKGVYSYAALALVPYHLRMGRSVNVIADFSNPQLYLVMLLFLVTCVSIFIMRKQKLFIFGLIWFSLPLAVQLFFNYSFARRNAQILLPEHNLYFCYVGLLISFFSVFTVFSLREKVKQFLFLVLIVVVGSYAYLTTLENKKWGDEIRLFSTIVEYNKNSEFNYVVYANLGHAYERKKEYALAQVNFSRAAETSGGNPVFYNNFARFFLRRNDLKSALEVLLFSQKLDKGFYPTYFLLGVVYQGLGQDIVARENYKKVLLIDPANEIAAQRLKNYDQLTRL